jgi:hypothetical protein
VIGAGTFLNPLIKVVTTVAILAAIYFLIVRPILDTTEGAIDDANRSFAESQRQSRQAQRDSELQSARTTAISTAQSLRAGSQPWNEPAKEVIDCVKGAGNSLPEMKDCEKLADHASDSLHSRNFATSYADSLQAQGKSSDAARVDECVADAGYSPVKMSRCQQLADELLFG